MAEAVDSKSDIQGKFFLSSSKHDCSDNLQRIVF